MIYIVNNDTVHCYYDVLILEYEIIVMLQVIFNPKEYKGTIKQPSDCPNINFCLKPGNPRKTTEDQYVIICNISDQ